MLSSDEGSLDYFVEMLHYQILVARVVIGRLVVDDAASAEVSHQLLLHLVDAPERLFVEAVPGTEAPVLVVLDGGLPLLHDLGDH